MWPTCCIRPNLVVFDVLTRRIVWYSNSALCWPEMLIVKAKYCIKQQDLWSSDSGSIYFHSRHEPVDSPIFVAPRQQGGLVHLYTAMQFISEFIWVNLMWNEPTWQAKTITSYFALKKRNVRTWLAHSTLTNQRLKSADLRHWQTKTSRRLGSTLGLGQVMKDDWKELQACCHLYF